MCRNSVYCRKFTIVLQRKECQSLCLHFVSETEILECILEMSGEANFVLALEGISFRDWVICMGVFF